MDPSDFLVEFWITFHQPFNLSCYLIVKTRNEMKITFSSTSYNRYHIILFTKHGINRKWIWIYEDNEQKTMTTLKFSENWYGALHAAACFFEHALFLSVGRRIIMRLLVYICSSFAHQKWQPGIMWAHTTLSITNTASFRANKLR